MRRSNGADPSSIARAETERSPAHSVTSVQRDPEIAVIIPAYNAGRYLDHALASLAAQTHQPAVVAVADDCSTDDTLERAVHWQGLLPIEILQLKRNLGPGQARHHAIRATSSDLLAILDSDDVLLPDHLATLLAAYEQAPGLVTGLDLAWIPGHGIDMAQSLTGLKPVPSSPAEQLLWLLRENTIANPLFSRAAYEHVGGFRKEFFWGEDWDLWLRMVRAGVPVTRTSHPTALRRIRRDSLTANFRRNAELGLAVLDQAAADARSPLERSTALRARRALSSRRQYYASRELAEQGRPWQARLEATRGLGWTDPKAALRLGAMIAAPRTVIELQRATMRRRARGPA
jgi:glycosyltransferase involved in cell wall biosynthesis